ncbi:hypothetical protein DFP75_101151 [Marinomonas alcarazii]|uniref:Uncharacterized protein n=1 Tax=Marinomonas alcarazii TaxID=491949 RepID=A0A318V5L2_9GAMM|nr:hypothetical protein [Marinomonas alcarazii]PYF84126.1 hypothetical protein DFP75_101151 [Marinomonas alcarazii]
MDVMFYILLKAINLVQLALLYKHFEHWAIKSDIPWRAIKPHLDDAIEKARPLWPEALKNLPMNEGHKQQLRAHWQRLDEDFRV